MEAGTRTRLSDYHRAEEQPSTAPRRPGSTWGLALAVDGGVCSRAERGRLLTYAVVEPGSRAAPGVGACGADAGEEAVSLPGAARQGEP